MVKTTRKQREALFKVFQRDWPSYITPFKRHMGTQCPHCGCFSGSEMRTVSSVRYREFRKQARTAFGDSCIMLPWKGMWLGIETDGYTHS